MEVTLARAVARPVVSTSPARANFLSANPLGTVAAALLA
jgi:hypothetical protein